MTRPTARPFKQLMFRPLAPHIQREIDTRLLAEINQAWHQKQLYEDLASFEPTIISVDDDAWQWLNDLLDQPAEPSPNLAAAFAKPRRFIRIDE